MSADNKTDYVLSGEQKAGQQSDGVIMMPSSKQLHDRDGGGVKQGHKCCGGCCDMRRAVIIVNCVSSVIGLLALISMISMHKVNVNNYDDDQVKNAIVELENGHSFGVAMAFLCIRVVCNIVGVYGAYVYSIPMVGVALAAFCFEFVASVVALNLVGVLVAGFFGYPHVFYIMEVRKGTMSKENYHNEEQSCCCV